MSYSKLSSAQMRLMKAEIISVETDISRGLHSFSVVGLADKAVEESRDRVSAAIKNSGFKSPKQTNAKIIVSLAPAQARKGGPSFDLPIALGYLVSSGNIAFDSSNKLFVGELSLDGSVRPVQGTLSFARTAQREGFKEIYVPTENALEASLVEGMTVFGVSCLRELIEHLEGRVSIEPTPFTPPSLKERVSNITIESITGNPSVKRALMIAAAGRHNIALYGPPGTGKTLSAKALQSILPPLSFEEVLEVTEIHSAIGSLSSSCVLEPPVRSPHHTSSAASIIGGGSTPRPGEITLAHRGILCMDEFPEFRKDVIEALRQPMEDGIISFSRAHGGATFPARFMLVVTMNICPCGNRGSEQPCRCSAKDIARYEQKLSGPIVDRIDMWIEVPNADKSHLIQGISIENETDQIRQKIMRAHAFQIKRANILGNRIPANSPSLAKDIRAAVRLSPDGISVLEQAATQYKLSGRGIHRIIRLARTIADLEESSETKAPHILEALQYRQRRPYG